MTKETEKKTNTSKEKESETLERANFSAQGRSIALMKEAGKKGMMQGKNKILLFRLLKNSTEEAAKLAFQTDHSFSLSRDADAIETKDGSLVKLGDLESEISGIEAVQSKDDPVAIMLQDSIIEGDKLEVWEIAVDEDLKQDETYPAMYAQGYLTMGNRKPNRR